jgi:CRP/FNR family transcriptional regulator, cyclic AMP receptor protein
MLLMSLSFIKRGKVKVTVLSKQGKEAVVALLGADEFLGEGCLIGQPKRLATATAMTECVTMRVAKSEILQVLKDEPAFSQMFISHILARNARVEADLVDQLFNSTEKRLARLFCCWPTSVRKESRSLLSQRSARRRLPK